MSHNSNARLGGLTSDRIESLQLSKSGASGISLSTSGYIVSFYRRIRMLSMRFTHPTQPTQSELELPQPKSQQDI